MKFQFRNLSIPFFMGVVLPCRKLGFWAPGRETCVSVFFFVFVRTGKHTDGGQA